MFSPRFDQNKLKTNLRICEVRLKNLYAKKNELNIRARKELSDYLKNKKIDRARIRVEQIVREDYLLEALEIIELYCELLITRLGLITSTAECDPGLKEAIATLIWVAPRLSYDCKELEVLSSQFTMKYGKEFARACLTNSNHDVNAKVMHNLNVKAPPANICEAYLVEIARRYDVEFTPDPNLLNNVPQLLDLGEPPELPPSDLGQDFLKFDSMPSGSGAPYPPHQGFQDGPNPSIPSIPPDNGPNLHDVPPPIAPPAYPDMGPLSDKKSEDSDSHKSDDEDDKDAESKKPDGASAPPPPSNDDDDFDALAARFQNLRKNL